jgi:hypothetical protein
VWLCVLNGMFDQFIEVVLIREIGLRRRCQTWNLPLSHGSTPTHVLSGCIVMSAFVNVYNSTDSCAIAEGADKSMVDADVWTG